MRACASAAADTSSATPPNAAARKSGPDGRCFGGAGRRIAGADCTFGGVVGATPMKGNLGFGTGDSESDGFSDCPSDVSAAERTDSVERRGRATGDGVSGRELLSSIDAEAAANR